MNRQEDRIVRDIITRKQVIENYLLSELNGYRDRNGLMPLFWYCGRLHTIDEEGNVLMDAVYDPEWDD